MQVDHVVPQSLEHDSDALAKVLQELGRPKGFNLQNAQTKADRVEWLIEETKSKKGKSKKGTQLIVLVW